MNKRLKLTRINKSITDHLKIGSKGTYVDIWHGKHGIKTIKCSSEIIDITDEHFVYLVHRAKRLGGSHVVHIKRHKESTPPLYAYYNTVNK